MPPCIPEDRGYLELIGSNHANLFAAVTVLIDAVATAAASVLQRKVVGASGRVHWTMLDQHKTAYRQYIVYCCWRILVIPWAKKPLSEFSVIVATAGMTGMCDENIALPAKATIW